MKKVLKRILISGSAVLMVSILIFIVVYSFTPLMDQGVIRAINSMSGENVKVSYLRISGNLLGTVRIDSLNIQIDSDSILCRRIEFNYSLLNLARKKFFFDDVSIEKPQAFLGNPKTIPGDTLKTQNPPLDSMLAEIIFEKLPDIRIKKLKLREGELHFLRNGSEELLQNIELQLTLRKNHREVELNVEHITFFLPDRKQTVKQLSFYFSGDRKALVLQQFHLISPDLNLSGDGELILEPSAQLYVSVKKGQINLALFQALGIPTHFRKGVLNINGSFQGTPHSFSGNIIMKGDLDSLHIENWQFDYQRHQNTFYFSNINFRSNFGNLSGELQASPEGNNNAYISLNNFDLKKMGVFDQATNISGLIDFKFKKWDLKRLSGYGTLMLHSARVGKTYLDSLKLSVTAQEGDFSFSEPSKIVFSENSQFYLSGDFTHLNTLDLSLQTTNNRLDSLFRKLGIAKLGGVGKLKLHVTGPVTNPNVRGSVYLDSLYLANMKAYIVEGSIDIREIFKKRTGTFILDINSGHINDFQITQGQLYFSVDSNHVSIDTVSFYSGRNNVIANGNIRFGNGSVEMKLNTLQLQYENYVIRNEQPVELYLQNDTLQFRKFELNAANSGSIVLRGQWIFPKSGSLKLAVVNTRMEPFKQFIKWKYDIKGAVDAELEFRGELSNPDISGSLQLEEVFLDSFALGSFNMAIDYHNNEISFERFQYKYRENSYLTLEGKIGLVRKKTGNSGNRLSPESTLNLNLTAFNLRLEDYAFLFDINYPFQGSLSAALLLNGTFGEPRGYIKFLGDKVSVSKFNFPYFEITGRISPDMLLLDKALVNFADTEISAVGYKTVDWDFRNLKSLFTDNSFGLLCKIEEDSVNFLSTVLPDVDRVIGDISVEAKFGGNFSHPMLYDGKIDIKNGLLYITKIENPIRNISLQAHVKDHTVLIDKFNGRSPIIKPGQNIIKKFFSLLSAPFRKVVAKGYGDGSISAYGSADFFYLKRPKLDLHFSLNDAYFNYFLENMSVVVNSKDIHVSGRDTILVAGDATVKNGDWQLDFIESEKNILLSKSVRQTPPYIQYLLNVEIPDNFFVRSNMPFNTFDIELAGDVQIIREPKRELEMNGQLKVLPGGKYFIQVEDFNVNSGEINFVNPKEYPELNLAASRQKNDYLFELTVTGPLNNPVKDMRTRNLKTNEEIYDLKDQMTLLLFGVQFRELSGLSDSALVASGGGVLTQTLLNQFEWQARQYTGLDKIRFGSHESYDYFSGWPWEKQQQTSTLALGKYFTPDLYLEYQAKLSSTNVSGLGGIPTPNLSWESGNLVYMKYRLTKNWALSSFYQRTINGNNKVRFDVSWQLSF